MIHFKNCIKWSEFVNDCRNVYDEIQDLKKYKHTNSFTTDVSASRKRHNVKRFRSWFSDRKKIVKKSSNFYFLNRFSSHIQNRLKKKRRCYKCLKKKHVSTDENASCKHEKSNNVQNAQMKLTKMRIDWDDVNVEEYESKTFCFDENDHFHNSSKNWESSTKVAIEKFLNNCAKESDN